MRGLFLGAILLPLIFLRPATLSAEPAEEIPVVPLAPADIPKIVILLTKPSEVLVEVTYSKPKQEEFLALTQAGLPKKIRIAINGRTVSERVQTKPATGHSFKVPMDSLDAAFALAETIAGTPPVSLTPPAIPATGEAQNFALVPADVARMALFILKPNRFRLDISCTPGKRAELAALATAHPSESIRLVSGGKTVTELPASAAAGLGAISIEIPSQSEAFALTRLLAEMSSMPAAPVK